ncbi:hypothetical protein T02_1046 [Trichinella nativa]|uniref:Uncharacterized protein n=1 Tax=Trichinella nativa TaxID=6335 RepID=A0A0V1KM62_9BILA|nr:hypothetical protein T02_1046 [Trichinella nativa]
MDVVHHHAFAGSRSTSNRLGRVSTPRAVRSRIDRTMPSLPGRSSVITPSFQRLRGTVSSVTSTKSSTSGGRSIFFHLPRTLRETKYSSVHRFHKWRINSCWCRQRLPRCLAPVPLGVSPEEVGSAASSLPMRKCAGVSGAQSFGSSLKSVSGRLLMRDSNSHKVVRSSSKRSRLLPSTFRSAFLTDRTSLSQYPPLQGALSVVYLH